MSDNFSKSFRDTIANVISRKGDAFNPDVETWGDSRGKRDWDAEAHMRSGLCSVESMSKYEEEYSWMDYDTMNTDNLVGIRAFINCKCGAVEHVAFILPNAGLSTILGWLLEED